MLNYFEELENRLERRLMMRKKYLLIGKKVYRNTFRDYYHIYDDLSKLLKDVSKGERYPYCSVANDGEITNVQVVHKRNKLTSMYCLFTLNKKGINSLPDSDAKEPPFYLCSRKLSSSTPVQELLDAGMMDEEQCFQIVYNNMTETIAKVKTYIHSCETFESVEGDIEDCIADKNIDYLNEINCFFQNSIRRLEKGRKSFITDPEFTNIVGERQIDRMNKMITRCSFLQDNVLKAYIYDLIQAFNQFPLEDRKKIHHHDIMNAYSKAFKDDKTRVHFVEPDFN